MCVTDRHGMTLAAKVALSPNTTNQLKKTPFENLVDKGENADNHSVFYQPQKELLFLSYIYFFVCTCFEFGPVKKYFVW